MKLTEQERAARRERMAHARKSKQQRRPSGAEMAKRVAFAFELLGTERPFNVAAKVRAKFKIGQSAAQNVMKKARKIIQAEFELDRDELGQQVLHQLETIICGTDSADFRLRAIKQKVDLLGLQAPTRLQLVPPPLYDPGATAAMKDPKLRAQILQLEQEITDHAQATAPEHARPAGD